MKRETKLTKLVKKIIKEEMNASKPKLNDMEAVLLAAGLDEDDVELFEEQESDMEIQTKVLKFIEDTYSTNDLIQTLSNGSDWLVPSTFAEYFDKLEYPKFLAVALVQSESAESISDLWNIYYRERKTSKGARMVFYHHLMSNPKSLGIYNGDKYWSGVDKFEEFVGSNPRSFKDYGFEVLPELKSFLKKTYPELIERYKLNIS